MELPVGECGMGVSAPIGQLDTSCQELSEGRVPDEDVLPIPLKTIERYIESPLDIVHKTRLGLKNTIRESRAGRISAQPGAGTCRGSASILALLHRRIGAQSHEKRRQFGGQ